MNKWEFHQFVVLNSGVEIGNNVEIDNNASIGVKGFNRGFGKGNLELTRPLTGKIKIDEGIHLYTGADEDAEMITKLVKFTIQR